MRRISVMLSIAMLISACVSDANKAQRLFDQGKYSDVVTKYPGLPIAEQAKSKLHEAFIADSLKKAKQARQLALDIGRATEALSNQIKMENEYEAEFPRFVSFLRATLNELEVQNGNIASATVLELYQYSIDNSFRDNAEYNSNELKRVIESYKERCKVLNAPAHLGSHGQILDAIDHLSVIASMVLLTFAEFNPVALKNFGIDYLVQDAVKGIYATSVEINSLRIKLIHAEETFQRESAASSRK